MREELRRKRRKAVIISVIISFIVVVLSVGIPMIVLGPYEGGFFFLNYILPVGILLCSAGMIYSVYLLHKVRKSKYEFKK